MIWRIISCRPAFSPQLGHLDKVFLLLIILKSLRYSNCLFSIITSRGVLYRRHFLGRFCNFLSTSLMCSSVSDDISVFFGTYCLISPFIFSTPPFSCRKAISRRSVALMCVKLLFFIWRYSTSPSVLIQT